MIRDYWYIIALSTVIAILTIQLDQFYLCGLLFIWLLFLFYQQKIPLFTFLLAMLAFLFTYYYIPSLDHIHSTIDPHLEEQTTFIGTMIGPVEQTNKKVEFVLFEQTMEEKILVVYFPDSKTDHTVDASHLLSGGECTLTGEISIPEQARNPHQFDYQRYLLGQGITYQLYVEALADIDCENAGMLDSIYTLRTTLLQSTLNHLEEQTAAWLHALVLGDDSQIDSETIELFQRWSLSHILAISGLHIGIVVGLLYLLLVRLSLFTKETAQWMMIVFLPIYALVAGGQPSVWRASLMVLFVILLNKLKWKLNYTDVISIVFLLLILFDRYIVYHIGFQLSFAVTFGLILSQHWIAQTRSNTVRILYISFVSQMVILPLQLHYFSLFQPLSIVLNLLIVPYFSLFVIPAMFGLMIVHWFPALFLSLFERFFLFVHERVLFILQFVDQYVNYPFVIGEISLYFTIIYYVLFVMMMTHLEKQQLLKAFRYGLFICVLIIVLTLRPYFSPVGSVTMLDIGQGDAFIIELPYRKAVFFIDIGANFSFPDFKPTEKVYKQVIKPYLYGQGITKIDAVFISHEDLDHYGSIMYALEDIHVEEIIISPYYNIEPKIDAQWQEEGIPVRRMAFNESMIRNGQLFQALAPKRNQDDANENSLVLFTQFGGKNFLFTGDIGKHTEREIITSYPNLQLDVLKVGHHGSNTSTDPSFVHQTAPDYGLISVGRNNSYGHPTKEVIETLSDEEVTIYRTDEHGAVQYFFTEEEGEFRPFLKE